MSDIDPTTVPPPPAPVPDAPEMDAPGTDDTGAGGPDWKAEARKWESRAKSNADAAARLAELEDAQRTDDERLRLQLEEATRSSAEASEHLLRLEVALEKAPAGMDPARIRKLAERLRGSDRDEIAADAAELFAEFDPPARVGGSTAPVEELRPGALPVSGGSPSIAEQVAAAEKAGDWALARSLKSVQLAELRNNSKR